MGAKFVLFSGKSRRIRRSAIGLVISYALAFQGLLAGFAGVPASPVAGEGLPAFELCLNGSHESPDIPAGAPGNACSHCILCLAGLQDLLGAPPPNRMQPVSIETGSVSPTVDNGRPRSVDNHSAAQPRAPPTRA
jgi:hypothetical protein